MFKTLLALVLAHSVSSFKVKFTEPTAESHPGFFEADASCDGDWDCLIVTLSDLQINAKDQVNVKIRRTFNDDQVGGALKEGYISYPADSNYHFTIPINEFVVVDATTSFLISGGFRGEGDSMQRAEPISVEVEIGKEVVTKLLPVQPATLMWLSDTQECVDLASNCFWNGRDYEKVYKELAEGNIASHTRSNRRGTATKFLAWQTTDAAMRLASAGDSAFTNFTITFWSTALGSTKDGGEDNPWNFTIPAEEFPEYGENSATARRSFAVAIEGFKNPDGDDIAITDVVVKMNYPDADRNAFPGTSASLTSETQSLQDPHLSLADGGVADFRGSHNGIYNMLSSRAVSVNALFREQDFFLSHDNIEFVEHGSVQSDKFLVHGTFMFELYTSVRTSSGRLLHLRSEATSTSSANLAFLENGVPVSTMSTGETRVIDDVTIVLDGASAIISTPSWEVVCMVVNSEKAHFMNLKLAQRTPESVAPHGVIGQSYDGDGIAVDGAQDKYSITPGAETVTSAQAEGAIEGVHTDYLVDAPFATEYKFARFDRKAATARNVQALSGKKLAKRERRKLSYMLERLVGGAQNVAAAN